MYIPRHSKPRVVKKSARARAVPAQEARTGLRIKPTSEGEEGAHAAEEGKFTVCNIRRAAAAAAAVNFVRRHNIDLSLDLTKYTPRRGNADYSE